MTISMTYLSEFLEALQAVMNQMSVDGIRISHVPSRSRELSQYMSQVLDESWRQMRGFEVQAVGIANISYDEESKELINMRNKGAMLGDPSVREGYVQGSIARGIEAAGSNEAGAAQPSWGSESHEAGGQYMGQHLRLLQQMQQQQGTAAAVKPAAPVQPVRQTAGHQLRLVNQGKFCPECGNKRQGTSVPAAVML